MGIKYFSAEDIRARAKEIIEKMNWKHIDLNDVGFLRSTGSSSRRTLARCHALSRPMQLCLGRNGFYLIEVISEKFDKLDEEEQTKVIIHELMHIPKAFGGGFIHHHLVNDKTVNRAYEEYKSKKIEKRWF
jgi:predicted metallopeptidase